MFGDEIAKFEITDFDLNNEFNMNRPQRRLTENQAIYAGGVQNAGKNRKEIKTEEKKNKESYSFEDNISAFSDEENSFDNDQELAGLQKKKSQVDSINRELGDCEKYTKGIGAKLLFGMGYQPGCGLGKNLQGILTPIEINLRKGRGGIGAYGPESKTKSMKIDSKRTATKSNDNKVLVNCWILNKQPGQRKQESNELNGVKVIHFTGSEQTILSGYRDIYLPEQNIITNNQELCKSEDRNIFVEQKPKKISENIKEKMKSIESLDGIFIIIDILQDGLKKNMLDSSQAIKHLTEIKENCCSDYWLNSGLALASLISQVLIKKMLSTWDPLKDPTMPLKELNDWKKLLIKPHAVGLPSNYAFRTLIQEEWVPLVHKACRRWKCQKYNSMLILIEQSAELIPSDIINTVLKNMILPQIQLEVEQLDPLTDLIPIRLWIHPWLPYLSKYFETTVYPTLRQKLSIASNTWHLSKNFPKLVIQPWINVFQQSYMEAFLIINVIPKLQTALCVFDIHPYNQQLDCWNWVNAWSDVLPLPMLVELLDQYFFPRWIYTLTMWKKMNPDHEHMINWYSGWKCLMPARIVEHPTIKDRFHSALDIICQPMRWSSLYTLSTTIYRGLTEHASTAPRTPHSF